MYSTSILVKYSCKDSEENINKVYEHKKSLSLLMISSVICSTFEYGFDKSLHLSDVFFFDANDVLVVF